MTAKECAEAVGAKKKPDPNFWHRFVGNFLASIITDFFGDGQPVIMDGPNDPYTATTCKKTRRACAKK